MRFIGLARTMTVIFTCLLGAVGLSACARPGASNSSAAPSSIATENPVQSFPLDAFLPAIWLENPDEQQRMQLEAEYQFREQYVTQCMHDAGFVYDPNNLPGNIFWSFGSPQNVRTEELWRPHDRDWIAQWGYGIVNPPEFLGFNTEDSRSEDNNLSDAEIEAFSQALFGQMDFTAENGGCVGAAIAAWREADASNALLSNQFAPLHEALINMLNELNAEVSEAERDWTWCMADAGFPGFERQNDARFSIMDIPMFDLSPEEHAALTELEITTALADFDCRVATNFQARQDERRIAAETQFIQDHRHDLAALQSAMEQGE